MAKKTSKVIFIMIIMEEGKTHSVFSKQKKRCELKITLFSYSRCRGGINAKSHT